MKGQKVLFSHNNDDWETPQDFFDEMNKEFNFLYDLASNGSNKKAFLSPHDDIDSWDMMLDVLKNKTLLTTRWAWCNPPYSNQIKFVKFSIKHKLPTVFLLPARTDTKLFHDLIYKNPEMEIKFLKGRLKFKRGLASINSIKSKIEGLKKELGFCIVGGKEYEEIIFDIERLEKSLASNDPAGFPSMIVVYRPNTET